MTVSPTENQIRFGLFELDLKESQLSRNGTRLRLAQQPLQLLAVLLERPGEIVTREELRNRLWPSGVFVDFDHGLNKSIQKLRDVLGDSAGSPRYIETIPRLGYRFIAPVSNGGNALDGSGLVEISGPSLPTSQAAAPAERTPRGWILTGAVFAAVMTAVLVTYIYRSLRHHPAVVQYTQLTDFTNSASSPALSPDGHILAFIRGSSSFMSTDEIYAKVLPDGEARRLTNDSRIKYNLAFSPDGSRIAYTVLEDASLATYTVSVLGGDPQLLMKNAAGLTWLDQDHLLFSRFKAGIHLGVVTQPVAGGEVRELYYPRHERGMAHFSYASPDRKSALVVAMDGDGNWAVCQLIPLEGSAEARPVGPQGACTSAGWSPDGTWMYLIATVAGQSHLWRQRFPDGQPEQLTSGPVEEEWLAVEPEGHAVITSIGVSESSIWLHDDKGERSLSSEGEIIAYLSPPSFSMDGKTLYYLLRHPAGSTDPELFRLQLDSGKSESVFPGTAMISYDVSPDGKQVVYATPAGQGKSEVWLAPMDRGSPPRRIGHSGELSPHFGPQGQIVFQLAEGRFNYLEQMNQRGAERAKVVPYPIVEILGVSPARKWLTAVIPYANGTTISPLVMAVPLEGGPPRRLCTSFCSPVWSSSGKFLFIQVEMPSGTNRGRSLAIPAGPGETLSALPSEGIPLEAEAGVVPGAQSVDVSNFVPGEDPAHFAYVQTTAQRNLYRISLP